ncbi:capsular polysaccharide biosynthesis protein [Thiomicrorhabdus immobilis]|uniref:Capsular polysaccharide biosynthesis protein n=1 Tax=Thiomicrorhabdus immobilis TaxID=2791037 RepID=A0ABN6CV04_9GAMM|nr:capsular biosynthesis protein [Thiomicrorhabdus immobilis]BCN92733.1 capsular polysaccharide biosynthesis protein [Thiomicrorhabdus immobilis]
MKLNKIGEIKHKNILLLQGPMGSFFKRLDKVFREKGATTYRIGFNAGDAFFSYRDNYTPYKDTRKNWVSFIEAFLHQKKIDQIYLFGDCRFYQSQAIQVAKALGIDVFVFEEGYLRPNYITLEKFGVNHFSVMRRDRAFYDQLDLNHFPDPSSEDAHFSAYKMIFSAIVYYFMGNVLYFLYPHYQHHRGFSGFREAFFGIRNLYRKQKYKITERGLLKSLVLERKKQYFFVPLQTHNDFQILQHSGYRSLEKFIIEVIESFAKQANQDDYLLFKHHPVDRGRMEYSAFINRQASKYGVEHRVNVVHDLYLPTCLQNAKGTITINSTVGLSSIYHGTPVLTLGYALYDIEGLTNKGVKLDDFWHSQAKPDSVLFEKYRRYLIQNTQLNGSFYGKMPDFED